MSNLTYFRLIPSELVELIVSKLSIVDTHKFDFAHSGYLRENIIYYDYLNVFNMRYPYLAKILKLKRNTGYEPNGFIHDANENTYRDYEILSRDDKLHDYFVTGVVYPNFIKHFGHVYQKNAYNIKNFPTPILIDVYSREYPQIFNELNRLGIQVNLDQFTVALYLIDTATNLLEFLIKNEKYHIDFIDGTVLNAIINLIIKKNYIKFIARSDPREIEGVVGLLLKMISDEYQRQKLTISQHTRNWMKTYVDSYKEKLNLPLLPLI